MSELFITFKPKLTKDIKDKIKAQEQYAKKNKVPLFAPSDGYCWSCGKQIYSVLTKEYVSSRLITGCPICYRSYCD